MSHKDKDPLFEIDPSIIKAAISNVVVDLNSTRNYRIRTMIKQSKDYIRRFNK